MVGKGENAGYRYFLLFPQYFSKAPILGSLKVRIAGNGRKHDGGKTRKLLVSSLFYFCHNVFKSLYFLNIIETEDFTVKS